ncbi:MAG: glucose-6-phosphate isomerase [Clostridia bacterium]
MGIEVNLEKFDGFYSNESKKAMFEQVALAHKSLFAKTGKGNDFLGWIDLPKNIMSIVPQIKDTAKQICEESEVLVVIGIGGSYLGARSAIEVMKSPNYNIIDRKGCPQIFFAGNNISADHLNEIVGIIGDRDFSVNIISKSGGTAEPAISFHFFEQLLKQRYADEWTKRVYVTTDAVSGDLRKFADKNNCVSYVVDGDVGGRFSVLSAVGLLPIACAGIDIEEIVKGAISMRAKLLISSEENPAMQYAAARNLAYNDGKTTEILGCYEPRFRFVGEWWKQLFGESEGKDQKGIFPASVDLTADLHSMGQYIQDGLRNLFETIVHIENNNSELTIEDSNKDFTRLELFEGLKLSDINTMAMEGTAAAHIQGGVPNVLIKISDTSEKTYGEMVYFFEVACGLSAYVLGVNPFDQPGVEAYKKEMIKLVTDKLVKN